MITRMSVGAAVAWLLLLLLLLLSGTSAQHWSYGLSPGGKRQLDPLSHTLDRVVDGFQHLDKPCSILDCTEVPPFGKIYRMRVFPGGVPDRENERRPYEK